MGIKLFDRKGVQKLTTYIEENLRASKTAGFDFIDPRNHRERLISRQNHVVFGRRGAGKSTLLSSILDSNDVIVVDINIEDFKDITFPNIVLHILAASLEKLNESISSHHPWYKFNREASSLRKQLKEEIEQLRAFTLEPDVEERDVRTTTRVDEKVRVGAAAKVITADYEAKVGEKKEVTRKLPLDKLNHLRLRLSHFKGLINSASLLCSSKPIYLALDDFYFADKSIQPDLIDYFHRMTKGTNLFIKLATIKHRSYLYKRTKGSFVGVELGHDIFEVDLDYTLDNFADLKGFMMQLLDSANENSNAQLEIRELFAGEGFNQLCLASGGVPRDFLTLIVRLITHVILAADRRIGKVEVNEEAIASINGKLEALKFDSGGEDVFLEEYLSFIRNRVYSDKRTNAFLVAKPELDNHPQSRQAIRELVDFRLIHVVDKNTSSAPSDGRRYEAYIIDVCLYENSRPRNFRQIEPGVADKKSRKDAIRAAPRISLPQVEKFLINQGIQLDLFVTDIQ